MSDTIKGSIYGAIITGAISLLIFFLGNFSTQATIEKNTVQTLSGYFESVEKDMTYEQALQTIYKENENAKDEISRLTIQLNDLQNQINQQNSAEEIEKIIQNATEYGNTSNFVQALSILNNVKDKTSEIEILINDYSQKYESHIIEQVNTIKTDGKLDEASSIIKDAMTILPNSEILKDKLQEIENSYPKNMLDIVPAYQSGGNTYKEYISSESGATKYFTMGGVKYTNGMTFNADINIFDDVSWAVYNLEGKYNTLEFTVCHVDGTFNGDKTSLQVFYDGELKEEIPLAPDMIPQTIALDISGVKQLKMQVHSSGSDNPLYGLGNPMIK